MKTEYHTFECAAYALTKAGRFQVTDGKIIPNFKGEPREDEWYAIEYLVDECGLELI